jgi:hypothetical protein
VPAMPRRSPRRQVELSGSILSENNQPKACRVTNISPKGAKLTLTGPDDLPCEFTLSLAGAEHRSRLVWRVGLQAGVEFIRP